MLWDLQLSGSNERAAPTGQLLSGVPPSHYRPLGSGESQPENRERSLSRVADESRITSIPPSFGWKSHPQSGATIISFGSASMATFLNRASHAPGSHFISVAYMCHQASWTRLLRH